MPSKIVTLFGSLDIAFEGVEITDAAVSAALAAKGCQLSIQIGVSAPHDNQSLAPWGELRNGDSNDAVWVDSEVHHCAEVKWGKKNDIGTQRETVVAPIVVFTEETLGSKQQHGHTADTTGGKDTKLALNVVLTVMDADGRVVVEAPPRRILFPSIATCVTPARYQCSIIRKDIAFEGLLGGKSEVGSSSEALAAADDLLEYSSVGELSFTMQFIDLHCCVSRVLATMYSDVTGSGSTFSDTNSQSPTESSGEQKQWIQCEFQPTFRVKPKLSNSNDASELPKGATGVAVDDRGVSSMLQALPTIGELPHLVQIPYGCLPLYELYNQCLFFFNAISGSGMKKVKVSKPLQRLLMTTLGEGSLKWERVRAVDFSKFILGDVGITPLICVLQCCRGLTELNFSQNSLSFSTVKKLLAVFHDHPCIERIHLERNDFFESAGEEILRLCKLNRGILDCHVAGNAFTPKLHERIGKQCLMNCKSKDADIFNSLSVRYDYLGGYGSVSEQSWKHVQRVWSVLIASPPAHVTPISDIQLADGSSVGGHTADDNSDSKSGAADEAAYLSMEGTLPLVVVAPLFSDVIRGVHYKICRTFEDDLARRIFTDVTSVLRYCSREDLYATFPISYAKMISVPLRVAADFPHRWPICVGVLQGLGEMHYQLGVGPIHYRHANKLFLEMLELHLGNEIFDETTKMAMVEVMALITRTVLSGTPLVVAA